MTNHELRRLAHQALRREPLRLIGLTALMAAPFFAKGGDLYAEGI